MFLLETMALCSQVFACEVSLEAAGQTTSHIQANTFEFRITFYL